MTQFLTFIEKLAFLSLLLSGLRFVYFLLFLSAVFPINYYVLLQLICHFQFWYIAHWENEPNYGDENSNLILFLKNHGRN